jgi:hypothetical protein
LNALYKAKQAQDTTDMEPPLLFLSNQSAEDPDYAKSLHLKKATVANGARQPKDRPTAFLATAMQTSKDWTSLKPSSKKLMWLPVLEESISK